MSPAGVFSCQIHWPPPFRALAIQAKRPPNLPLGLIPILFGLGVLVSVCIAPEAKKKVLRIFTCTEKNSKKAKHQRKFWSWTAMTCQRAVYLYGHSQGNSLVGGKVRSCRLREHPEALTVLPYPVVFVRVRVRDGRIKIKAPSRLPCCYCELPT